MLSDYLKMILRSYMQAQGEQFKGHELADLIRHKLPDDISIEASLGPRYVVKGSAGQGNWARCPWVAVLDILVTDTPQDGFYPCYLFREDMQGVYLSLNQGVTRIQRNYRAGTREVLQLKAKDYYLQLEDTQDFGSEHIYLATSSGNGLGNLYEAGNIIAKYYPTSALPSDEVLLADFELMLQMYQLLAYKEALPTKVQEEEESEIATQQVEDLTKFVLHKRIERNQRLVREVKRIHGYICEICGFDFSHLYGEIGVQFIEAHHLVPLSEIAGKRVSLDPDKDFAVLCSNCHSMIHRFHTPQDIEAFKEEVFWRKDEFL